jgi:hypothetical protein
LFKKIIGLRPKLGNTYYHIIVNAPTMQSFENRLHKYWNNLEMKYNFKTDTGTDLSQEELLELNTVA